MLSVANNWLSFVALLSPSYRIGKIFKIVSGECKRCRELNEVDILKKNNWIPFLNVVVFALAAFEKYNRPQVNTYPECIEGFFLGDPYPPRSRMVNLNSMT